MNSFKIQKTLSHFGNNKKVNVKIKNKDVSMPFSKPTQVVYGVVRVRSGSGACQGAHVGRVTFAPVCNVTSPRDSACQ